MRFTNSLWRRVLYVAMIIFIGIWLVQPVLAENLLKETLGTSTVDANQNSIGASYNYSAFNFTATSNYSVKIVQIYVSEYQNLDTDVVASIFSANSSGGPGVQIGKNSSPLNTFAAGNYYNFTFEDSSPAVVNNTKYFVVFHNHAPTSKWIRMGDTAGAASNFINWEAPSSITSFENGQGGTYAADVNIHLWGGNASNVSLNQILFNQCPNESLIYNKINFTFKDEETLATLNGSILGTSIDYYLDDPNNHSTLTTGNTTEYEQISFCSNMYITNFTTDFYMPYSFGTYPQRIFRGTELLSQNPINKVLYLLGASSGQYVTFQVINSAEQVLDGVYVEINKTISGTERTISTGYTGSDGGITFWLNPDDVYKARFSLSPYDDYTISQSFTQTSYTITLGQTTNATSNDYTKGITYSFKPALDWLNNNTDYNFNFTLTSTYWALSSYGYNITNEHGTLIINNSNTNTTGGFISNTVNTGLNDSFYVTYFWIINGTNTHASRSYRIINLDNNGYSITRLFTDFSSYVSTGFFGLTDFGVGLIVFFIIVITVGTAKVKFGLSDEATLTGIIFALVVFFDVGIGLLPNPIGSVSHFPSILMGIIFIGFAAKEVFQ